MIFASFVFLFWFLPAFLPVYFALPPRARNLWLTVASFVFYGWWRPSYVVLMFASAALDYACARAMGDATRGAAETGGGVAANGGSGATGANGGNGRIEGIGVAAAARVGGAAGAAGWRRKRWLILSVVVNLGLLGWFKYANLLVGTWNDLAPWPVQWTEVLLPIGISFYTFQSMSYTIDVYRGDVRPTRSFVDLLCYVTMFPQLVAGPIVRYRDVEAQLRRRSVDLVAFSDGVFLFAIGFAKKVLLADQVAPLADAVFGSESPGLVASWTGVLAYAMQIYFDFSGYSDMAIGLGAMLGLRFPSNFLSPYRAHSVTEFWRRWHVSLSTWLRDYLYIPLGGNRRGEGRTYANLATTMLLGGLWHGAAWTFVLWGAWQGAFLVLERRIGKTSPYAGLPRPLQVVATFAIVLGGWAIFRAGSLAELGAIWAGMVGMNGVGAVPDVGYLGGPAWAALLAGTGIVFALPRSELLVARFRPLVMLGCLTAFVVAVGHLLATEFHPFLYWRF